MTITTLERGPLPHIEDLDVSLSPNITSAYNVCRNMQDRVETNDKAGAEKTMYLRILGYLILHAPTHSASHEVAMMIHQRNHDEDIFEIGKLFYEHFILAFRISKGRTPKSSSQLSRASFTEDREAIRKLLRTAPKNHEEAKKQALIRDGYKCVVTGQYDERAAERLGMDKRVEVTNTHCAHIVPESICFNLLDADKLEYSSNVLAILKTFGCQVEYLSGPGIHSLRNVMTLAVDVHESFDQLRLWFEPTNIENCYHIKTVRNRPLDRVTFASTEPSVDLPSPELLKAHAYCAKVAHSSGAGVYIDDLDSEMGCMEVLDHDGQSYNILMHALACSMPRTVLTVS